MRAAGARRILAAVVAVALVGAPMVALAQGGANRYLNHDELTTALRGLVSRHGTLAELSSLTRTDAGRDVWLLTLGRRQGGADPDSRSALLIVANLEANHLIGSATALATAEHLLTSYGRDAGITRLLDEHTVYLVPRANPDGAELVWSMAGYEIPYKPVASDPSKGGMNVRELGVDLNGDGLVTLMRVPDPAGTLMADPAEPRLMREANRARAERGRYRVMVEGIDPKNVEAYVAAGTDGVNLNRNFQHEYLYFQPHVGPHMVSEVESRALVDFAFDHPNIAAVLTFSAFDNLRTPPPADRRVPPGVTGNPPTVPTNIQPQDRPYFEFVSTRFQEMTSLRGAGADNEAGSFPQFVYYQLGLPSFTTPVWTLPPPEAGGRAGGPGGAGGAASRDARWLAHFAASNIDAFVDWTPARHPTLGDVEVGGFEPNARVNPPPAEIAALAASHAGFAAWLGQQLPKVEVVETTVEPRGEEVFLVTATVANEGYFPTQLQMGGRIQSNRPITIRLMPSTGMTVLSGNIQQQIPRLDGMGGRRTFTWLVQAAPGTSTTLELFAERAGGLMSTPITLR
ncbi:MAG TPA: M14 family metallopeptidase [Vicinamibacterales bacterium]|nr:M14 family metallopeptidase [Vicinamibacterales bacterium]